MNKKSLYLSLIFLFLLSCKGLQRIEKNKLIRKKIEGKALNLEYGAALKTKHLIYYIEGMESWPVDYFQKEVEVLGLKQIVNRSFTKKDSIGNLLMDSRLIIINPKRKSKGVISLKKIRVKK